MHLRRERSNRGGGGRQAPHPLSKKLGRNVNKRPKIVCFQKCWRCRIGRPSLHELFSSAWLPLALCTNFVVLTCLLSQHQDHSAAAGCCTKTVHHATCEKKRWQNFTILTPTYTFRFIVIARAMCYDKCVTTCWDSPPRNQMDLTSDNDTQGLRIACAGPDHVRNYTREGICFNSGLFRIPGRCRARFQGPSSTAQKAAYLA